MTQKAKDLKLEEKKSDLDPQRGQYHTKIPLFVEEFLTQKMPLVLGFAKEFLSSANRLMGWAEAY